ncbi:MAG: ArdC-like ssDNA-binding domain-containing protein [Methylococcales bacterium]
MMARKYAKPKEKRDLYQDVTNFVLSQFDEDTPKWRKPWVPNDFPCSIPFNVSTGKPYRGINNTVLQLAALDHADPRFMTYKQSNDLGCQVMKGEKGNTVLFYKTVEKDKDKTDSNTPGDDDSKDSYLVARGYTVFNAQQIAGLSPLPVTEKTWDDDQIADMFIEHMITEFDTDVKYGTDKACNIGNKVRMPHRGDFSDSSEFYATMFHEMTHRTQYLTGRKELDLPYEHEELVAELGAMFLSRKLNMPFNPNVDNNSASYIKGWTLKANIEDDKNLLFKASRLAQEAVEHVLTPSFMEKVNQIQGVDEAIQLAVDEAADPQLAKENHSNKSSLKCG